VRPRYGRITAFLSSLTVSAVAVVGATGLDSSPSHEQTRTTAAAEAPKAAASAIALSAFSQPMSKRLETEPAVLTDRGSRVAAEPDDELPASSGNGKRVVFDVSEQRVWLVEKGDEVRRTYLVSGSLTDNLQPGTYEVYSTSRHAVGIDDSGTMEYMVRFAHGKRAAIGFHDIPVDDGKRVQTRAELGTPQSHGCIRQARPDARALWNFAIVGTKVVVTA
jgi:lipoprotein-anchoring transpeptidase ErfK/SrfK